MSKHYDVVVLGNEIGALAAAALLARRSWRVLVLGHGAKPATYAWDGVPLARRPSSLLAGASPAWARVLIELAQSQTFRRRVLQLDPMLQILTPKRRFDMPPDDVAFGREVDREFPEVRRVIDDLYAELARTNAAADAAFEKDVIIPPGGFWERRETNRALAGLPHLGEQQSSLLAELPRDHDYLTVVSLPVRFATDLATELPPFALARLHGAWTRGVGRVPGGDDELRELLLDRVRAHGGEVADGDRAAAILHRGGKVSGVLLHGEDKPVGVQFVVSDEDTRSVLELAEGFAPSRRVLAELPRAIVRAHRFVVSVVVRDRGLPRMLARDAFLDVPELPVMVQRWSASEAGKTKTFAGLPAGTSLLVCEALLDVDSPIPVAHAREAVLQIVQRFLPFVERHYLIVDSAHDGLPLEDYRGGARVLVDRARLRPKGGSIDPERMIPLYEIDKASVHGLAGESLRTPLSGAFIAGRTAVPALGQEGQLLAAWGVARIITKTDRRKDRMRRELWSKVEIG